MHEVDMQKHGWYQSINLSVLHFDWKIASVGDQRIDIHLQQISLRIQTYCHFEDEDSDISDTDEEGQR